MLINDNELMVVYNKTVKALEEYIKETKTRPNEKVWNKYAVENNYLSSETIGYICGIGFNKLCKDIIKSIK